ncbi:MAG TPA: ribonuclease E/G, partial [Chitinophagales bacterium]|nr:ribonuclease E/G [Chitinophagales bacterium]
MERELIINATSAGEEIALLENKQLVEIHRDRDNTRFNVGDMYLGRVKKINPGLNAVFVDVGYERDAFLHYTDLNPHFRSIVKFTQAAVNGSNIKMENFEKEPLIIKTGKVNNVLSKNMQILVQVIKEPIQTKGPRLSCELSLPGRYLVLTPFNEVVGVSRKIESLEERKRLQKLIESIRPKNFGVIVRTVAAGVSVQKLHEDLLNQLKNWEKITEQLSVGNAPKLVFSETSKTNTLLRDILNESFNEVIVNDAAIAQEIKNYIKRIAQG